ERHISGAESSLWPTFLASEAEHGGPSQRDASGRPTLTSAAQQIWRTPQAEDSKSGYVQRGYTENLAHQVQRWPTPEAKNGTGAGQHGTGGPDLQTAVQRWPTPTAIDAGSGRINQSLGPGAAERP